MITVYPNSYVLLKLSTSNKNLEINVLFNFFSIFIETKLSCQSK